MAFIAALAAFGLAPSAASLPTLRWSFFGAAAILLCWNLALGSSASRQGRRFRIEVVLRKQHYLQACAHLSIYIYWGWYWRQVYASAYLILAQLVFAYAFDMLLAWSRRDTYLLGFGPFPVIFSTNLFLWFKPEWFYLQFLMVGIGFLAKELIRWQRDGRSTHVFNPSSFTLAIFSLGLLATGTTDYTWGREIATTLFHPPHIYLWIFLVSLPGQLFFGVTSMTLSAVVTVYAFSLGYFAVTGTYFFFDAYIPIAVFLGMHLLFTDPSTSPRTELGRIIFGILYGISVTSLYWLLGLAHTQTFYDKLLPVPILNLLVPAIDRCARSPVLARFDPRRLGRELAPRRRNLAYITVWSIAFAVLSTSHGLADSHPGNRIPFWQNACKERRRNACRNLATMESTYCNRGLGWACNELGILVATGGIEVEATSTQMFERACQSGFATGCTNLTSGALKHHPPLTDDYRSMLETKGYPPADTPLQLMHNACDQGWTDACVSMARMYLKGDSAPLDRARAAHEFDKACSAGEPTACSDAGLMYRRGDGVRRDDSRALAYLKRACELGLTNACRWLHDEEKLRNRN